MKIKWKLFFSYLIPTLYLESYKRINLEAFKKRGIKLIICDMDNTLIRWDEYVPNADVEKFFLKCKKMGFEFVIFSNNIKERVMRCAKKIGVDNYFWDCRKPFKKKLEHIKKLYNYDDDEIIFVGDQIITDIIVSNRAKIKSVLVRPLSKIKKGNKFEEFLEKRLFELLGKNNLLHEDFFNEREYYDDLQIL